MGKRADAAVGAQRGAPGGTSHVAGAMTLPMPKEGTGLHTISFDGDGCLWEPTWPSPVIGEANPRAVKALLEYRRLGYEIIIFTSRPASHLPAIRRWLYENDLNDEVYDIVTGKPRAAMYIDDRAVTFPESFGDPQHELHLEAYRETARQVDENVRMAAEAVGFEAGVKYGRRKAFEEQDAGLEGAKPDVRHDAVCFQIVSSAPPHRGDHWRGEARCRLSTVGTSDPLR